MAIFKANAPPRQSALAALAIVGFIALVLGGAWLAAYSSRFVPEAVNRLGAAAVYLGSVFGGAGPALTVVPMGSTTIPFGNATTTPPAATSTPPKVVTPSAGSPTTYTPPALYGLPDLLVTVTAIGYMTTTSTDSFVASGSVPPGMRPAVKFVIKNTGTNVVGPWRFRATLPTNGSLTAGGFERCEAQGCVSHTQLSLLPSEYITYTLGFDRGAASGAQAMTIAANYDNAVAESNTANNSISLTFTLN